MDSTTSETSKLDADVDIAEIMYASEFARYVDVNKTIERGDSDIQQFYNGAVVLVTGGSGFLGKQLIEKLFRSCQVKKIYILLRKNARQSIEQRKERIIKDKLYEYLHENQPGWENRLIPIAGDIIENRVGLSELNWRILTEEVNVIFHVAATVNFLEHLKVATLTNVRGTREMMTLAQSCQKLQSFVHISTAYCHSTLESSKQPVLEQFYPSPVTPELLIQLAEKLDENTMDTITPQLLGKWPNTYAFTKAVSEEVVRSMTGNLPVCIVRPAIVMQAFREPPGWADRGTVKTNAIGFIVGICIGGIHVFLAQSETCLDAVPVDYVNNAAIAAGYKTALQANPDRQTDVKIYTVTRTRKPVLIKTVVDFLSYSKKIQEVIPPSIVWFPYCIPIRNRVLFFLLTWLLHYIPGYLVDGVFLLLGRKPIVTKLFDKAYKQNKVYSFYTFNDWHFDDSNLMEMIQTLSPADRINYECDTTNIDAGEYIFCCAIGARKYIFKEGLKGTEYGKKKYFWFSILNAIYIVVYTFALFKLFSWIFKCLYSLY